MVNIITESGIVLLNKECNCISELPIKGDFIVLNDKEYEVIKRILNIDNNNASIIVKLVINN